MIDLMRVGMGGKRGKVAEMMVLRRTEGNTVGGGFKHNNFTLELFIGADDVQLPIRPGRQISRSNSQISWFLHGLVPSNRKRKTNRRGIKN